MSRVGEKIKEARLKSGMSLKMLAKKLGVAEKFINEVELGRKVAQESFIDKAAKVLNTDFNDVSMVVTDEALLEERKA
ncbi:helix-turn-helix domain-containing protein, partial [Clostridium perfringens]